MSGMDFTKLASDHMFEFIGTAMTNCNNLPRACEGIHNLSNTILFSIRFYRALSENVITNGIDSRGRTLLIDILAMVRSMVFDEFSANLLASGMQSGLFRRKASDTPQVDGEFEVFLS